MNTGEAAGTSSRRWRLRKRPGIDAKPYVGLVLMCVALLFVFLRMKAAENRADRWESAATKAMAGFEAAKMNLMGAVDRAQSQTLAAEETSRRWGKVAQGWQAEFERVAGLYTNLVTRVAMERGPRWGVTTITNATVK